MRGRGKRRERERKKRKKGEEDMKKVERWEHAGQRTQEEEGEKREDR